MIVDFHVHSTASDGTFTPVELAEKGRAFAAIALTDHDNCDGLDEFLSCASLTSGRETASPFKIPGIELSIEPGEGFDKFHLLGLGIDPRNEGLRTFLKRVLDGRNARNERILANFRRLGIEMEDSCPSSIKQSNNLNTPNNQTIFSYAHGEVLARPHFAHWLVDHGQAANIRDAFAKYLLPDSPVATRCYEERWHPSQEEAFRAIHEAGGICVMAHPKYWRNDWKATGPDSAAAERELAALKERGLDGIEALYQANTNEENVIFTRIAVKFGYFKTAGSDFHGANKPTIPIGMEVSEDFIAPVLECLNRV